MKLFKDNEDINNTDKIKADFEVYEKIFDDLLNSDKEFKSKFDELLLLIDEIEQKKNRFFSLKKELEEKINKNLNV